MELENPNFLPEEILIEIFSRLPAKAVGRCRCLSKTWCTKLSTSQFVNLHLSCRTSPEILLFIDARDHSLHTIDAPFVVDNTVVSRKLELGVAWNRVLGSCNGLVLLSSKDRELYLVNPITLEHFKLPHSSLGSKGSIIKNHALGYDSSSDDYKVVVFWSHLFAKAAPSNDRLIDVYSVKSGAWKSVDKPIYLVHDGTFMNGAVHWVSFLVKDDSMFEAVIHAFDLADYVFRQIPAPPTGDFTIHNIRYLNNFRLLVLEGCLCMLWKRIDCDTELWMMKEYGLADSWTKFTILTNGQWDVHLPLCFLGDGEILLVTHNYKLVVYNLKEGTRKYIVIDGVLSSLRDGVFGSFVDGVAFVDSLVSPNHRENGKNRPLSLPNGRCSTTFVGHGIFRQKFQHCGIFRPKFQHCGIFHPKFHSKSQSAQHCPCGTRICDEEERDEELLKHVTYEG